MSTGRVLGGLVAAAVLIYTWPIVALWRATGWSLTPWVSPDVYLYVQVAGLHADAQGMVRDPWYGGSVDQALLPYDWFNVALALYALLRHVVGSDALALVLWHASMGLTIALALRWMLQAAIANAWIGAAAMAAVLLVDANYLWLDLRGFVRETTWVYGLPFGRTFYPQAAAPLILIWMGALLRWIADRRRHWLVLAFATHAIEFLVFPYACIVMLATTTVVAIAGGGLGPLGARRTAEAAGFTAACLAINLLTLAAMPQSGALPGTGDAAILLSNIDWRAVMGWPLVAGVLAVAAGRGADATALVFGGFGVAFGLTHLAGAVVSPRWTLTAHIDYFYALAFWLPWVALARTVSLTMRPTLVTPLAAAATIACLAYGLVDVRAYIAMWRPFNVDNGVLARFLRTLDAGPADLVVTPVHGFKIARPPLYWEASWVPLAVTSTVLYTSGAAMFQPAGSPVTAERLAAYLYLGGEDAVGTRQRLEVSHTTTEQHFLVGHARQGQLQSTRRAQALGETRDELVPRLEALAAGALPAPIAAANRVIVADYAATPLFDPARIEAWLQIDSVSRQGAWIIRVGRPRLRAARPAA